MLKKQFHLVIFLLIPIFSVLFLRYGAFAAGYESVSQTQITEPYALAETLPDGSAGVNVSGGSSSDNLAGILNDLKVNVYPEDKVSIFPDINLKIGGKITLLRAPSYQITDGKKVIIYRSWTKTVGELLNEKNIELGNDDKINFAADYPLELGMQIKIIRVARTNVTEKSPIDFKVVKKNDSTLNYGKTKVQQVGVKGELTKVFLSIREDGEEISRTLVSSSVTTQPVDEVDLIGTKVTVLSSVSGLATRTNVPNYVVSANYPNGALIRISANGVSIFVTVNATWGTASPPDGVIMDLSQNYLSQLKCSSSGCQVLEERIQQ